jgi:hypothetical protein
MSFFILWNNNTLTQNSFSAAPSLARKGLGGNADFRLKQNGRVAAVYPYFRY